ncbi:MAG TPA: histidine kinase [Gemmatimonadaceae bacterium]|nr:histidine kinase [Gemmatimonadaceae bacterium]
MGLGLITALEARHISTTHGFPREWEIVMISTMPRWILLAIVLPFVLQLAMRFPLTPLRVPVVALHILIFLSLSVAHAVVDAWAVAQEMPEVVHMFAAIPRMTRSWYNTMPTMVSLYGGVLLAAWGITEARERQRRTLRASQLESQLQAARLAALRAQVQPHFLYNTLNGIAALVSDLQPTRAVAAIEQLGELLHASFREDGRDEVTITEEVALAERYLSLQKMRFGDRLAFDIHVHPDAAECLVPVLLLQPIVENAVVHGLDAGQERLNVTIRASATANNVELTVDNDGALVRSDPARTGGGGHGVGLASTRARLITAHGDRASLTLVPRAEGGATVRIEMPRKLAPAPAPQGEREGTPA